MLKKLVAIAAMCVAFVGTADASVDRSPPPGGVYRLKPGIYVEQGVDCASPPNVALRRYDGRGISSAHTRACRATVLARKGNRYTVSQSCVDAGAGAAPRSSERQIVTVPDALTFSVKTKGTATTFRYCPANILPAELR